jgi:hypothetical protein
MVAADCIVVNEDDSPLPVLAAVTEHLRRDELLWRESPALEPGCEHDLTLLPIIEFRVTVVCRNCGGLDKETSRLIQRKAMEIRTDDGTVRLGTTRLATLRQP